MWNLAAPPGFVGLDPDRPVRIYQRHLPHWRQEDVSYFVTFRLADSLPQAKLDELRKLRDAWRAKQTALPSKEAWEELAKGLMERTERWLDQGMGSCARASPAPTGASWTGRAPPISRSSSIPPTVSHAWRAITAGGLPPA